MSSGTLTVGMTLQFKPEMYLKGTQPAGYDVDILHLLAAKLGVKLHIDNLAFTGLIPGLQAKSSTWSRWNSRTPLPAPRS